MTSVMLGGKFNKIHKGHIWLLNESKKLGGKLIVIVANDVHNNRLYAISQEERKKCVESLHIADVVDLGDKKDYMKVVRKYKPDIIVLGYDQKLPIDEAKIRNKGIKIVKIKKYGNYSSRVM